MCGASVERGVCWPRNGRLRRENSVYAMRSYLSPLVPEPRNRFRRRRSVLARLAVLAGGCFALLGMACTARFVLFVMASL